LSAESSDIDNTVQKKRYQQFFRLFVGFLLVIVIGTVGYRSIERDWSLLESLYMTIITITTVGFSEVMGRDHLGAEGLTSEGLRKDRVTYFRGFVLKK